MLTTQRPPKRSVSSVKNSCFSFQTNTAPNLLYISTAIIQFLKPETSDHSLLPLGPHILSTCKFCQSYVKIHPKSFISLISTSTIISHLCKYADSKPVSSLLPTLPSKLFSTHIFQNVSHTMSLCLHPSMSSRYTLNHSDSPHAPDSWRGHSLTRLPRLPAQHVLLSLSLFYSRDRASCQFLQLAKLCPTAPAYYNALPQLLAGFLLLFWI